MRLSSRNKKYWVWGFIVFAVIGGIPLALGLQRGGLKKHDFTGKCQICHTQIPPGDAAFEDAALTLAEDVDNLCVRCHDISKRLSHPVGVVPSKPIALQRYLDRAGKMTCITCHDVHKEDKTGETPQELAGFLRGHAAGRTFCSICHNEALLGAGWRHTVVVNYAHTPGEFVQNSDGGVLDEHSVECLSCHDGVISKLSGVEIHSGEFKHSVGLSHPVGVAYPLMSPKNDFVDKSGLPEEIKLFQGKVGCLSCHSPYGGGKSLLVVENRRSTLCLACHKK